jgi:hypothetical protein
LPVNKASQRDAKTAASLWFCHPCWQRYIAVKNIPIFISLIVLSSNVVAGFDEWRLKSVKQNYVIDQKYFHNSPSSTEIEFTNGHTAKTKVIEFKFITFLHSTEGETFIMFTGRTCTECDMGTSIYIKAAAKVEYDLKRYGYPGKIESYLDGEPISETRMFYGQCLVKGEQTIIFYSNYLGNDNNWHKDVFAVDFQGQSTIKNPNDIPYETIRDTEKLVKLRLCSEIFGRNRYSEP